MLTQNPLLEYQPPPKNELICCSNRTRSELNAQTDHVAHLVATRLAAPHEDRHMASAEADKGGFGLSRAMMGRKPEWASTCLYPISPHYEA